ncbi:hypothetical protein M0R45_010714 [Rubus argutus]|uniref:Signal recognition particle 9 kDa protein n=1 Tax=Rubus argutus TaxID=59490 RepID=A0AAW1Y7X7_RUBAR
MVCVNVSNNSVDLFVDADSICDEVPALRWKIGSQVTDNKECLKFKTDQAQDAKKMEKLNNIFFTLMARGPEVDPSEVTGKDQVEAQPTKKGRGRKQ